MKMSGRLGRSPLKSALCDAMHAVMFGLRHHLPVAALQLYRARFTLSVPALIEVLLAKPRNHRLTRG